MWAWPVVCFSVLNPVIDCCSVQGLACLLPSGSWLKPSCIPELDNQLIKQTSGCSNLWTSSQLVTNIPQIHTCQSTQNSEQSTPFEVVPFAAVVFRTPFCHILLRWHKRRLTRWKQCQPSCSVQMSRYYTHLWQKIKGCSTDSVRVAHKLQH